MADSGAVLMMWMKTRFGASICNVFDKSMGYGAGPDSMSQRYFGLAHQRGQEIWGDDQTHSPPRRRVKAMMWRLSNNPFGVSTVDAGKNAVVRKRSEIFAILSLYKKIPSARLRA